MTYAIERFRTYAYAVATVATIGQNLARLRERAEYTPAEFARELDLPTQSVSDWENDRRKTVDVATLLRWAKALKCSIDDFVVGLDPEYDALSLSKVTLSKEQRDWLAIFDATEKGSRVRDIFLQAELLLPQLTALLGERGAPSTDSSAAPGPARVSRGRSRKA